MPIVSHAGGLGAAPLVFILGILGLILHLSSAESKLRFSPPFVALAVLFLWLSLTSIWSPYRPDDFLTNYIKLFIMGLIFYFCPVVFKHVAKTKLLSLQRVFLTAMFLSAFLVLIDVWTGFKITLFFNPASGPEELSNRLNDTQMNLGHAITVLVLLSTPVTMVLKTYVQRWKFLSLLYFGLVVFASYLNDLWVGIFGSVAVIIAMLAASKFPKITIKTVIILAVLSIILGPLLAFISALLLKYDLSAIPISWEHRIQMWAYCWPVIVEHPFIGAGFDAVRTFDEQWTARDGTRLTLVSLHPHNAGIHIWAETGLIGCMLAVSAVLVNLKLVSNYTRIQDGAVFLSGLIIAVLIISSTTYGVWQFWWWASVFFALGLVYLLTPKSHEIHKV